MQLFDDVGDTLSRASPDGVVTRRSKPKTIFAIGFLRQRNVRFSDALDLSRTGYSLAVRVCVSAQAIRSLSWSCLVSTFLQLSLTSTLYPSYSPGLLTFTSLTVVKLNAERDGI